MEDERTKLIITKNDYIQELETRLKEFENDKPLREAIKKLSQIADFNPITDEIMKTATFYLSKMEAVKQSKYIHQLERSINELVIENQELKVENERLGEQIAARDL